MAPYGSWPSPITADRIAQTTVGFAEIVTDGSDIYWSEGRPKEGGREVVVRRRSGEEPRDVTPPEMNVRTRAHEYGGGAFTVAEGTVYCTNFSDQRLYRQTPGESPRAITAEGPVRYADMFYDPNRQILYGVREDHRTGGREAVSTVVALNPFGDAYGTVLVEGPDFCSSPQASPDGRKLAWLCWNHPNMPWDGTELWVADIGDDGRLDAAHRVAGGASESIFQPAFAPDGTLHFASDRTGWWNLYALTADGVRALCPMDAEFGLPQWRFGLATYGFLPDGTIVAAYQAGGTAHLGLLGPQGGELRQIPLTYTSIQQLRVAGTEIAFIGGSPQQFPEIVLLDVHTAQAQVLRRAGSAALDPGYLSTPEAIAFPTELGRTAYAFYYPPANRDFAGTADELPPLLVFCHGGPTSATTASLNLGIQYFTSRGFAVVAVNYGGSAGYGRAYRERLQGSWGIVDVDDCTHAALHLAGRGLADPRRLLIRGGSAGGFTTLACLAFRDVFAGGASHFGVSDLEALATDSHKFESRYLDGLVGPYPERRDLYRARSPIHHLDRFHSPTIFFQGLDDRVVPADQAQRMVDALRRKGVPVAYVAFAGEGHGFRRAENVQRALEAELSFYGRVLGFEPADAADSVVIENL